MKKWETKKTSIVLMASILVMLTLFYLFFNFTFAWLHVTKTAQNTGTSSSAKVDAGLGSSTGGSYSVALGASGTAVSTVNLSKVTNNGTTGVVVRVIYTLFVDETTKEVATTRHISSITFNPGFLPSEDNIINTYSGVFYYNNVLGAGNSVSFMNNIVPTTAGANKTLKLKLTVEMVNYNGGAYQYGYDAPWENTPAEWFANEQSLTRPSGSVIGPKLTLDWANISKIEMVGKTTASNQNILFCTYGGAYIGLDNSNWVFNKLTASANITATNFLDGELHKVVFSISAVDKSAQGNSYIGLIWNADWSKEVDFVSIKFYDINGTVLANLVPDTSGKFYDKVSKALLPMYAWSGATFTTTTNTYYDLYNMQSFDGSFESYNTGNVKLSESDSTGVGISGLTFQLGTPTVQIVNTEAFSGNKSLKISGEISSNKRMFASINVLGGRNYRFSVAIKSKDLQNGKTSMSRTQTTVSGTGVFNSLLEFEMNGGDYSWAHVNGKLESVYSCSGEWEILTIETGKLTSNTTLYAFIYPVSGFEYYIDNWLVKAV